MIRPTPESSPRDVGVPLPYSARQRNRDRLIEAALALWTDQPEASMDDVAVHAGVVRRTLYGHFRTREDLVVAVAERATDFIDEIASPPQTSEGQVGARLAAMATQLWTFGRQLRLVWSSNGRSTPGGLAQARGRITTAVATLVAEGQAAGEFSNHAPPLVVASVLESAAAVLHEASLDPLSGIGSQEVALTSLLIVGVDATRARQLIAGIGESDFQDLASNRPLVVPST